MCSRAGSGATRIIAAPRTDVAELVAACPSWAAYRPPWWLPGPHANTIGSALLRVRPHGGRGVAYAERTTLPVPHDGTVALDWAARPRPGQPVLLLLHGLTGGSHEVYLQWMVAAAGGAGLCPVVMNARGCGGTPLASPRCFSAAWTADVAAVAGHLRALVGPGTPLFAIGFSLGAGILAKYVAEAGAGCPLDGAVSVAAAFDLVKSSAALEAGWNRVLYSGLLTRGLQRYYAGHAAVFAGAPWADAAAITTATTVRAFDAAAIVPQFGYPHVDAYYADGSAGRLLGGVRVPFLALSAGDDPICSVAGLLDAAGGIQANADAPVVAVVTPAGGHVAWASAPVWGWGGPRFGLAWDNVAALEFFAALLARRARGAGAGEGEGEGAAPPPAPAGEPLPVAVLGAVSTPLPPHLREGGGGGGPVSMGGVELRLGRG